MAKKSLAFILAGGKGGRLLVLTRKRAKAALPFGGKYRVIDFTLSNCVNSGIFDIGLLTQFRPLSLNQHIGVGKPWDLDRLRGGIRLLQPYTRGKNSNWYRGTADAIYQNMDFINDLLPDNILVISGDQIYKMDYSRFISFHNEHNADISMAITEVPWESANRFGIVKVEGERVVSFSEKPDNPQSNLASMGTYLFRREFLVDVLTDTVAKNRFDLVFDVLLNSLNKGINIFAYHFSGYWEDIGTIKSYYNANIELAKPLPTLDLYDRRWIIRTKSEEKPPVKLGKNANVVDSVIANGCIVNGEVVNSVLFSGAYIEENAQIVNSIIMNDTRISKFASINKSILDKDIFVGEGVKIGFGNSDVSGNEITTIGKGTKIPKNITIGKNCLIDAFLKEEDFKESNIPSGVNKLKED